MLSAASCRFQVWSSGLEEWSPVVLLGSDLVALQLVHRKNHEGRRWAIYRDQLDRWIRHDIGPAT